MKKLLIVDSSYTIPMDEYFSHSVIIVVYDGGFYYERSVGYHMIITCFVNYPSNCLDTHIQVAIKAITS